MSNALYYLSDTGTRVYIKYHELGKEVECKIRRLTELQLGMIYGLLHFKFGRVPLETKIKGGLDWLRIGDKNKRFKKLTHGFEVLLLEPLFSGPCKQEVQEKPTGFNQS